MNGINELQYPTLNGLKSLTLDSLTADNIYLENIETNIETIDEALILNAGAYIAAYGIDISDEEISYLSGATENIPSQINTNGGNITTNAGNITTNAGNITTNKSNIETLQDNTAGFSSFGPYQGLTKTILSTTSSIGVYLTGPDCFLTLGKRGVITMNSEIQTFAFTDVRKSAIETNTSNIDLKNDIINNDNLLDSKFISTGIITNTEFNYLDGVTSNLQEQIDDKHDVIDINNKLDASFIGTGIVSNTEFKYLNNCESEIQTQIDGKNDSINSGNLLNVLFLGTGIISNATFNFLEGVASNIQLQINDLNYKVIKLTYDGSITNVAGTIVTDDLKTTTLKFITDTYSDIQNYAFTNSFKNKLDYYISNDFQAVINSYITNFYNKPGGVYLFDYGFTLGTNASRHDGTIDNLVINVHNEMINPGTIKFYQDKVYCVTGNLTMTNLQDIAHLTYYVLLKSGNSTVFFSDWMYINFDGSETMLKIGLPLNTQYFKSAYDFSGTTTLEIVGDYRCNPVSNGAQFNFKGSVVQVGI
jgi:hypothetical protein